MAALDTATLEQYDCLFIAPHGSDVPLACPARVMGEVERGRRALVLALFEPVGNSPAAAAVQRLRAEYVAAGLPSARDRRPDRSVVVEAGARGGADEDAFNEAVRLLMHVGPRTAAQHVYAPLGLGAHVDHRLTYEAAVRAFASETGRNLFLYEERPEAFVPGAVRTRLALLGARLPPGAARVAERSGLLRLLLRVNEPARLRGEMRGLGERFALLRWAAREWRVARPWNPLRAFGPRLQPVVHPADEDALLRARDAASLLLPRGQRNRPLAARRFNSRAAAAAKTLGAVYHAERFWLFLPSGEGLPEVQHPLESVEI
jgi:LmbE family N-acetylglucosaminyl deacetylase